MAERTWVVDPDPEYGFNPEQIAQAAVDATAVVMRLGGVVGIAAHRVEVDPEHHIFEPTKLIFTWNSFAPAERPTRRNRKQDQPVEHLPEPQDPELEPEPVEAA
jgi:hypothetical protein